MKYLLFIWISLVIFSNDLLQEEIKDIPKNAKLFYTDPNFTINKENSITAAKIVTTTLIIMSFDEDIREYIQKNKNNTIDELSPIFRKFGEFYPPLFLMGMGYVSNDEKSLKTGIYAAEASMFGLGISYIGKNIFSRARPYTENGASSWNNKSFDDKYSSFPSAHSTISFATAAVISEMYSDKKGVAEIAYILATLGALSRIYDDKHWASDVFLGSCIGYISGKTFIKIKEKENFLLVPLATENTYGLGIIGKF